jgi:hypothetical protein
MDLSPTLEKESQKSVHPTILEGNEEASTVAYVTIEPPKA